MTAPAAGASGARLLAVVLAGGTGERLGGVSKADLELAGRRLLDRVLDATADAGAAATVVVGDVDAGSRPGVRVVVEDPPRSGPAAGIVAGLAALGLGDPASRDVTPDHPDPPNPPESDGLVLVLACDLADPLPGTRALMAALPLTEGVDGLCLGDADGRPQWLFGLYRSASLVRAVEAFGTAAHRSVRALMAPLRLFAIDPAPGVSGDDIDTWEAHAAWSARLAASKSPASNPTTAPGTRPASG